MQCQTTDGLSCDLSELNGYMMASRITICMVTSGARIQAEIYMNILELFHTMSVMHLDMSFLVLKLIHVLMCDIFNLSGG
jgi:hypothetical protein